MYVAFVVLKPYTSKKKLLPTINTIYIKEKTITTNGIPQWRYH